MDIWRLQLVVVVLWAYEQIWNAKAGWQFRSISVSSHESELILIETLRIGSCTSQELLTASLTSDPPAELISNHWHTSSPWVDLEGWALRKAYHSLSLPPQQQDVYRVNRTVALFIDALAPVCVYQLIVSFHGNKQGSWAVMSEKLLRARDMCRREMRVQE